MLTFKKIIASCVVISVLTLIIFVLAISYTPKTLLSLVGKLTPYTVTAETINITLVSPSIGVKQLLLSNQSGQVAVQLDNLFLTTTWAGWLSGKQTWSGLMESGAVYVNQFTSSPENKSATKSTASKVPIAQAIHEFIGSLDLSINDVNIHLK